MSNREIIFLVEGFILGIAVFFMALGCLRDAETNTNQMRKSFTER